MLPGGGCKHPTARCVIQGQGPSWQQESSARDHNSNISLAKRLCLQKQATTCFCFVDSFYQICAWKSCLWCLVSTFVHAHATFVYLCYFFIIFFQLKSTMPPEKTRVAACIGCTFSHLSLPCHVFGQMIY